jgi:hypothetical protein
MREAQQTARRPSILRLHAAGLDRYARPTSERCGRWRGTGGLRHGGALHRGSTMFTVAPILGNRPIVNKLSKAETKMPAGKEVIAGRVAPKQSRDIFPAKWGFCRSLGGGKCGVKGDFGRKLRFSRLPLLTVRSEGKPCPISNYTPSPGNPLNPLKTIFYS